MSQPTFITWPHAGLRSEQEKNCTYCYVSQEKTKKFLLWSVLHCHVYCEQKEADNQWFICSPKGTTIWFLWGGGGGQEDLSEPEIFLAYF